MPDQNTPTQPAAAQPEAARPAPAQPTAGQRAAAERLAADPAAGERVPAQRAAAEPLAADPAVSERAPAQRAAEPLAADPAGERVAGGRGRAGLTPDRVVAEAAAIADERGIQALSLAPVAERLGVRVPSLYKHVGGLDDLHHRIALAGLRELAEKIGAATVGRSRRDALHACATAWRAYAKAHPGRYGAIQRAPDPADAELVEAAGRLIGLVYSILRGYGLDEDQTVHATRAVRSALHGFVTLEAAGGFQLAQDVDESYARLVDLLDSGLG